MKALLVLLMFTVGALAQGGSYCTMSTWEPRNLVTKAGLVASYDPGNTETETFNPAGYAAGSGVSLLLDRAMKIRTGNLLLQSESFNASWTLTKCNAFGATDTGATGAGSFANTARTLDPLGGNTADFVQEDATASSAHFFAAPSVTTTAVPYTFSVFVKQDTSGLLTNIMLYESTTAVGKGFNLALGTAVAVSTVSAPATSSIVTDAGWNGYYKCSIGFTAGASAACRVYCLTNSSGTYLFSYSGDNTKGVFVWGASLVRHDWTPVTGPTLATGYQVTTTTAYAPPDLAQSTAANQPKISRKDNAGNICRYSEDITQTSWTATDSTKTGAGELTFTAQNGKLIQTVPTASGLSYTFSFYARTNVPGNANMVILHTDSATGNSTGQTITGVLSPYSVTVLGKAGAGGNVSFGIQDTNASGFGSILFTNMQVRVNTWDSTYISTLAVPIFAGLGGRAVHYYDGTAYYMKTSTFPLVQPEEIYLLCSQQSWILNDVLFDGDINDYCEVYQTATTPGLKLFAGSNLAQDSGLSVGPWGVIRCIFNGANSSLTVDTSSPTTGDAGTRNSNGYTVARAGSSSTKFGNVLVGRSLICNKTNDLAETSYLSWGLRKQAGLY